MIISFDKISFKNRLLYSLAIWTAILAFVWPFAMINLPSKIDNPMLIVLVLWAAVVIIALLVFHFSSSYYIYSVEFEHESIDLKWQKNRELEEASVPLEAISCDVIPAGKDSPILVLKFHDGSKEVTINQGEVAKWNKKQMKNFCLDLQAAGCASVTYLGDKLIYKD